MAKNYRDPVPCDRECGRRTRSSTGVCSYCRGFEVGESQPGRPTVEEQAAWLRMRERVLTDLGYKPTRVRYGVAERVLRAEGVPDLGEFIKLLAEGRDGGLPVGVQGVRVEGGGRVRAVSGAEDPRVEPDRPGVHAAQGGAGGGPCGVVKAGVGGDGGAEAVGGEVGGGQAGAVGVRTGSEAGQEAWAEIGLPVRLTRYWCGVRAGAVGVTRGSVVRGGVTLVRVAVPSRSLFGDVVVIPIEYTELAS